MILGWRNWNSSLAFGFGVGAAAIVAGCTSGETAGSSANSNPPLIVVSYSVLCDMASQIAQDTVELDCLIAYDQDPHTYEGTPSDRQAIEQADLILYAGMNFEPSVIQMINAASNYATKIPVHEQAVDNPIEYNSDGQPVPDPHIWHDVDNGLRMVEAVNKALTSVAPDNSELYAENSEALKAQLMELDIWIAEQIQTIPEAQRQLFTTHDAMSYYSRAYGLTVAGTLLGLSPEEEPTAARVSELVSSVRETGVPTLFAELTTNDRVLRTVANEAGVDISDNVLIADGVGAQGTPEGSYQGMLEYNTCTIVDGLGGECEPFAELASRQDES